jgi:hypothetical protein
MNYNENLDSQFSCIFQIDVKHSNAHIWRIKFVSSLSFVSLYCSELLETLSISLAGFTALASTMLAEKLRY